MLPTDHTKRHLLVQQSLLQNRLAFAQGSQLHPPNHMAVSGPIAPSSLQASFLPMHGLRGGNGPAFQPPQDSTNVLQMLLFAEQERRLKRRLSEMQQQQQLQFQHHQQPQSQTQHIISSLHQNVAASNATKLISTKVPPGPPGLAGIGQTNEQQRKVLTTRPAALPSPGIGPVGRGEVGAGPVDPPTMETEGDNNGAAPQTVSAASAPVPDKAAPSHDGNSGASRKDARWKEMYDELIEYKKNHNGSCIVPRGFAENPRLASWVAEQRKQYKLMKDGRQSSITPERVELLNKVDFAWNAQEAAWVKHMTDLKSFRAQHGHCHVPLNDPTFPKLGLWVKEQRRHYTLMKQGKQSHMTEARCSELSAVGFCWDTHEATWLERLNELRAYKATHGHCIVPTNYPQNPKLGTWIHHQRRQYKKYADGKPCHITSSRIKALNSLGFVWHPRDKNLHTTASSAADLTNLDLRPRKRQRHS